MVSIRAYYLIKQIDSNSFEVQNVSASFRNDMKVIARDAVLRVWKLDGINLTDPVAKGEKDKRIADAVQELLEGGKFLINEPDENVSLMSSSPSSDH